MCVWVYRYVFVCLFFAYRFVFSLSLVSAFLSRCSFVFELRVSLFLLCSACVISKLWVYVCVCVCEKCVDRMQIGVYFGGARSLWWALFVYFYFRKKSTFLFLFFEGTLDRTMRPKCSIINFCSFQILNQWVNFLNRGLPNVCVVYQLLYHISFFLCCLHYYCITDLDVSENLMAISVLRVFAYLHVSSRTKWKWWEKKNVPWILRVAFSLHAVLVQLCLFHLILYFSKLPINQFYCLFYFYLFFFCCCRFNVIAAKIVSFLF